MNQLIYRIHTADRKIKYAGTGLDSWFTLDQARQKVDPSRGEKIYQYSGPGGDPLWEIL
jgi:hypothetical protein